MSQIRLTHPERIQALEHLGYSPREAAFLCVAALHGGYFLRRQYAQFLDKSVGGTTAALIEKALDFGHAKGTTYAGNTHIYHLCARSFYAALGQEDNRNRRLRQPAAIRCKLMALDFVMAHSHELFLATEQEKLDHFISTLGLEKRVLPAKRYASRGQTMERYFVEKFPIYLTPTSQSVAAPVVSFCFMDEGAVGIDGFSTFLARYRALFIALREFQVVYVAARPAHFDAAARAFARCFTAEDCAQQAFPLQPTLPRLTEHFAARQLYESQDWNSFDRARLIQYRNERHEFAGPEFDRLYELWMTGGDTALHSVLDPEPPSKAAARGTFLTYRLEQNYDLFASASA